MGFLGQANMVDVVLYANHLDDFPSAHIGGQERSE